MLAAFAIAFGTRRINPKERQNGLILAIAVELIVKLVAFLAVGAFVVWGLNGGIADLTEAAQSDPRIAAVIQTPPDPAVWGATTLLSAFAIILLPRQFHVTVVENHERRDLRTASWLFPAYLVLINLFVAPLAVAGLKMFPDGAVNRDLTVLALPLAAGARGIALLTMIGGLSAATAMVVMDSLALAITISNDLAMPLLLRRPRPAGARAPKATSARSSCGCAGSRSSACWRSASPTSGWPGRRRSFRSGFCRSPPSRRSLRPFSAACSGGAAPPAARSPA